MGRKKRGTFLAAGHDESRTVEEISGERWAGYSATLEKAGKVFQKNPLFMAKNLMLKGEDEAAVRLLENDTEKLPYYEVTRRFLLGVCYYRIGKEEQGKECMEYVIGHGNTLKCKEEAEKYVTV